MCAKIYVRTVHGHRKCFELKVVKHQGSAFSPLLFVTDVEAISREFRVGRINKAREVSTSMENIWKSTNIANDTKNVCWKQQHSRQSGHTTKKIRDNLLAFEM